MFTINQVVKRNDTGRAVRIVEVRPNGLQVFYVTRDQQDGHTTIFGERDLRPLERQSPHDDVRREEY